MSEALLTGLVQCAQCAGFLREYIGLSGRREYVCFTPRPAGACTSVAADALDELVAAAALALFAAPREMERLRARMRPSPTTPTTPDELARWWVAVSQEVRRNFLLVLLDHAAIKSVDDPTRDVGEEVDEGRVELVWRTGATT